MSDSATKRCGLGALIAAGYEITGDDHAAHDLAIRAMQPLYGRATLVKVNDLRGPCCGARCVRRGYRGGLSSTSLPVCFPTRSPRVEPVAMGTLRTARVSARRWTRNLIGVEGSA